MNASNSKKKSSGWASASKRKCLFLTWKLCGSTVMLTASRPSQKTAQRMKRCFNVSKSSIGMIVASSRLFSMAQRAVGKLIGPRSIARSRLYLSHTWTVSKTLTQTTTNPSSLTTYHSLICQELLKSISLIEKIHVISISDTRSLTFQQECKRYLLAMRTLLPETKQSKEE